MNVDNAQSGSSNGSSEAMQGGAASGAASNATPAVPADAIPVASSASVKGKKSTSTAAGRKRELRELAGLQDSLSAPPTSSKRPRRSVAGSAAEASLSPLGTLSDSPGASVHGAVGAQQAASGTRNAKRVIARSSESGDEQARNQNGGNVGLAESTAEAVHEEEEVLNVIPLTGPTEPPPRKIGKIKIRMAPATSAPTSGASASPSDARAPTRPGDAHTRMETADPRPTVMGMLGAVSSGVTDAALIGNQSAGSGRVPHAASSDLQALQESQPPATLEGQAPAELAEAPTTALPTQSAAVLEQANNAPAAAEKPLTTQVPAEQRARAMATKRKGPRATGESAAKRASLARRLASSSSESENESGASSGMGCSQAGKGKIAAQPTRPAETSHPASSKKSSSLTYVGATSAGPTDPTHNVSKLPTATGGSGTPTVPGAGGSAPAKKGSETGTGTGTGKPGSVPMPFKKKLAVGASGTPARTAAVAAAPAAGPKSAASGPSFLDSLFAGTIAQTDHEKQLAQEREEKARAAKETREREALEKRKQLMARNQDRDRLGLEQALRRESGAGNSGSGTEGEGGSERKRAKAGAKKQSETGLPTSAKPGPITLASSKAPAFSDLQARYAGEPSDFQKRRAEVAALRAAAKAKRAEVAAKGGFDLLKQGIEMSEVEGAFLREYQDHQQHVFRGAAYGRPFQYYRGGPPRADSLEALGDQAAKNGEVESGEEGEMEEGEEVAAPKSSGKGEPLPHLWTFGAVFAYAGSRP